MEVESAVLTQQIESPAKVLDNLLMTKSTFEAYKTVADKYILGANLEAALQTYQSCIAQFPKDADGYREMGVVQERLEDFDGQVESYEKALLLNDEQPYWLYVTLARLLAERGRKSEAIKSYQLGLERSGDNEACGLGYAELARLLSEQGNVKEALENYQQAIELQPELDWVKFCIEAIHYNQGVAQLMYGEIEAAERCFSQVDQVKSAWELPCWFEKGGKHWPEYQFDDADKFEVLKSVDADWPKISIITPSFNQGNFIEETILSVLNQRYKNVEYIVIDGSSTDNTISVLKKYQEGISITLVEEDFGQSDAINKGFRLATGDLLSWLNSDDMLSPGALHRVALEYLNSDSDVVAGICVAHREHKIEMIRKPQVNQNSLTVLELSNVERWQRGDFFFQPEVFFTKDIWTRCGSSLNKTLNYAMDHELWMRFAAVSAIFSTISWPVALFRKHANQKTSQEKAATGELFTVMEIHRESNRDSSGTDSNSVEKMISTSSLSECLESVDILFEQKNWPGMLDVCQKIVESYPENSVGYLWLGVAQEKNKDFKGQLASYERAITLQADQPDWLYLTTGRLLADQSLWSGAIEIFKTTIEYYPESSEAYRWLGFCQEKIGSSQEQLRSYQRAISLDENQPVWVYSVLISLLRGQKTYRESIDVAVSAMNYFTQKTSVHAPLYYELAKTQTEIGQLENAIESYRVALELNSGFSEAKDLLNYAVAVHNLQKSNLTKGESSVSGANTAQSISEAPGTTHSGNDRILFLENENRFLLLQLHDVQEELERRILSAPETSDRKRFIDTSVEQTVDASKFLDNKKNLIKSLKSCQKLIKKQRKKISILENKVKSESVAESTDSATDSDKRDVLLSYLLEAQEGLEECLLNEKTLLDKQLFE